MSITLARHGRFASLATLALAVLALAAAGCGGSSKSASSPKAAAPASAPASSGSSSSGESIPQGPNAGDKDEDNNGGPSDGDGNL